MKLSEAILSGAQWNSQCVKGWLKTVMRISNGRREVTGTCALAGALQAVGTDLLELEADCDPAAFLQAARTAFPILKGWVKGKCPVCGKRMELLKVIVDLNDQHQWTRGRIAGFVRKIEYQWERRQARIGQQAKESVNVSSESDESREGRPTVRREPAFSTMVEP